MVDQYSNDGNEGIPQKVVDYRFLINEQINDCRRALTVAAFKSELDQTERAVDVLEAMLIESQDKKYKERLTKLVKSHNNNLSGLTTDAIKKQGFNLRHVFILQKFELLISLATRIGFTYVKEVSVEI